ncbi:bifunctional diguanylate cyclase/phosphodiesterase [Psychromonas aquimarina]|uniref:bifunctional diguanylate cyclase/phosphodiesterase n=1 Tax=Psychromonas aquimarina TaxID=444919 RepID=UPI0003FC3D08|nr:EAL domain-containing protein [Psychromonas aquimarina]
MNIFKKNTWLIFYLIAFIGALLTSGAVYLKYLGIKNKTQNDQLYVTKMFNLQLSTLFLQYENVIDVLSGGLSSPTSPLNVATLDKIIADNPLWLSFAAFSPEGKFITSSNKRREANIVNLLTTPSTQARFKQALNSDHMVIGKASYSTHFKTWVLPFRKRLLDDNGQVIMVMTSLLDLAMVYEHWNESTTPGNTLQATFDKSFFPFLRTCLTTKQISELYSRPVKSSVIQNLNTHLAKQKLTAEQLRHSQSPVQVIVNIDEQPSLLTLTYNQRYQFWIHAQQPYQNVIQQLYKPAAAYTAFYLLLMTFIFILFKWVNRIEDRKIAALTYEAEHDSLTGLPNRTLLRSYSTQLINSQQSFTLLYLDLNRFSHINNTFGHHYGDIILIEVGKRIKQSLQDLKGKAVRFSGDEFIIVLESVKRSEIDNYCRTLLEVVDAPYLVNNTFFKISASVGISQSPQDARDINSLVSYADNSMAIAKKSKNNCFFFSAEMHQKLIKNIEIEQALHYAVSNNEISLVYQPQLDQNQCLSGVEALVRWQSTSLGPVSPDAFIPVAEEMGLMPTLGLYIMERAMSEISKLQNQENIPFNLSINVSVSQFMQNDFFDKLMECYQRYQSEYLKLTIEITESLFIESIENISPVFHKMQDAGISLSLDDFGTGYSSLNMLKKVPIDELKIDKSFIDYITKNKTDRAMMKSIIRMGKELDITVLAEGVETKDHTDLLTELGCDLFQGYYFSKPLALNELALFVKEHQPE